MINIKVTSVFYEDFNLTATNHCGSLHKVTSIFEDHGVNLTYVRTHHGNITPTGRETYTLEVSVNRTSEEMIEKLT